MELMLASSFGDIMTYVFYIFLALLVLLVMITVHEFGHYVAGKIFKFGIEEFSIGFGPKLISKKKGNGEVFSLRLIPLGGFCAFKGEDSDDTDPSAFNNKKPWQRIIVLISGAFMNYLLAVLIIIVMFGVYGNSAIMPYKIVDNPAVSQEYSFLSKDVILKADGKNVYTITDLMSAVEGKEEGEKVPFEVIRNGKAVAVQIVMRAHTNFKNVEEISRLYDALGIYYELDDKGTITNPGLYATGVKYGFFDTIGRSFEYSFKTAGMIFTVLRQLLTGQLGLGAMGGTITTITATAEAISIGGFRYLLNIASFIGVNLAVFNLLPFPALDGSRVVFTGIEWIRRKPISRKVEGIIHTVGLVLLLAFAILVDVQQCF